MEALVLALPGRGSVEVVTGSAEEVSASEVVTAEATGCVDCVVGTPLLLLPLKVLPEVWWGKRLTEQLQECPKRAKSLAVERKADDRQTQVERTSRMWAPETSRKQRLEQELE